MESMHDFEPLHNKSGDKCNIIAGIEEEGGSEDLS